MNPRDTTVSQAAAAFNATRRPPMVYSESALRRADLPPTQYVCGHPLYPVGHSVFLYGAPGVGKSFIQQGMNHTFAWGKPVGSGQTKFAPIITANILYVDFEGNSSLVKERSLALSAFGILASDNGGNDTPTDTDYVFAEGFAGKNFAERLRELEDILNWKELSGIPYSLLILDTFTMFVGGNVGGKNAYEHDVECIKALNMLAERYQLCIVLIHHPNKAGEMSGSVGRAGTCSIVAKFEKIDEESAVLSTSKNRVGPPLEFAYYADKDRIWRLATDIPVKLAVAKGNNRQILALLNEHGPLGKTELLARTGMPEGSLKSALHRMAQIGLVTHTDDGWRALFAPTQEIPVMPVYAPPRKCRLCGTAQDREYGCPNTACQAFDWDGWGGLYRERSDRPAPSLRLAAVVTGEREIRRHSSTAAKLDLETGLMDPDDPKRNAIKASMALMRDAVKRDSARYHPALYAEQPPVAKEEVWEGRNNWKLPVEPGTPLVRLDKNAAYLSAANTKLPIGALKHDPDLQSATKAYLDGRTGYHLAEIGEDELPCGGPFHTRTERGQAWITTPTLQQLRRHGAAPTILQSYTAPGTEVLLRPWIDALKTHRAHALETGNEALYAFVKNCYSLTIATMGESNANWEIRRPDWMHIIRAQAYANLWSKAAAAAKAGVRVVRVGNTDEIWLVDEGDWQRQFTLGTGLGQWKIKKQWISGESER